MRTASEDLWYTSAQDTVTAAVVAIVPDAASWTVDVRQISGRHADRAVWEYNPSYVLVAGTGGDAAYTVLDFDQPADDFDQRVLAGAARKALTMLSKLGGPLRTDSTHATQGQAT